LTNDLNVDFGRSTIGQLIELGLKYAVLHQKTDNSSPVAITLIGDYGVHPFGNYGSYAERNSFLGKAIISRKFSSAFSFQVGGAYVYDNTPIPDVPGNDKGLFGLSGAARYK